MYFRIRKKAKNEFGKLFLGVPCLAASMLLFCTALSQAQTKEWIDFAIVNNNWSESGNWNPIGAPGAGDDVLIGNQAVAAGDQTVMDQDFTINSLTLSNGVGVNTSGNLLVLSQDLVLTGGSTFTAIANSTSSLPALDAVGIEVGSTAHFDLAGGGVQAATWVNQAGGTTGGYGDISFANPMLTIPFPVFSNNGTLETTRPFNAGLFEQFVLSFNASSPLARLDLDGAFGNGHVQLENFTTLQLGFETLDFASTMNLGNGSIVDLSHPLTLADGALVTADAGNTGIANNLARFRGAAVTLESGAEIHSDSGTLVFEGDLTSDAGSTLRVTGAGLTFNANATINGDLVTANTDPFDLTVNGQVEINDAAWNWDANGTTPSTTVNPGGSLTINSDSIDLAGNVYNGPLDINDGTLEVNMSGGRWALGPAESLNLHSTNGATELAGSLLEVRGNVIVSGGDVSKVTAAMEFTSAGSTRIESGSSLSVIGDLTFQGDSTHTGEGAFRVARDVTVNGNTVIDMPNGDFELDNRNGEQTVDLNADWTLNVDSLAGVVGSAGGGLFVINIENGSTFGVNLTDPNAEWSLGSDGVINISASTVATSLSGSRVNVSGQINVNGDTRFDAPMTVESEGEVALIANSLYMDGGTPSDPNRIRGGLISGGGATLHSLDAGLAGYGIVSPTISFAGDSNLFAEDGILTVQGAIQTANLVGARSGATLNLQQQLDTANVSALELDGGDVTGATIQNNGTTRGHGTIRGIGFVNNGVLAATGGGQLVVDTNQTPDLDGSTGGGIIQALSGDLVIVNATDSFGGSASVAPGYRIEFQQPWSLANSGSLLLQGSASEVAVLAGTDVNLVGQLTVIGPARIDSPVSFNLGNQTVLSGNNAELQLGDSSEFYSFGNFSGEGRIRNLAGSGARFFSGAVVDTRFVNEGELTLVEVLSSNLSTRVGSFQQTSTGELFLTINGTAADEFGQILADNMMILDGTLNVELGSTFEPMIDDAFPILRAMSGISGQFSDVDLPLLDDDLAWRLDYSDPQSLWLRVISAINGDFNGDGTYDCLDVDNLVAEIASGTNEASFDLTGDGMVDGDDLNVWLTEAGNAELGPGKSFLPGDGNLDGVVDASDFNLWNSNKFTNNAAWCSGDFTADGSVDTSDFNVWNSNKFQSSDSVAAVPEPSAIALLFFGGLWGLVMRRRIDRS